MSSFEAKAIVKETKSIRAFHLAEAGIDRGIFKLNETGIWDTVYEGTAVTGYNGDITYSDIEGGEYRIKFSSGPEVNQITIKASGKDKTTNESRTIQAIYYKAIGVTSALTAGAVNAGGNFIVHWGPISSLANIVLSGSADNFFPRKYARVHIYDSPSSSHDHDSPPSEGTTQTSGPAWCDDEYREWHDQYDVPDIPELNNNYKTDAQAYTTATGIPTYTTGNIDLTGAYDGGGSAAPFNAIANIFTTYYAEGNATVKSCNAVGVLICKGNLNIDTSNKGSNYDATPHSNAWKEYVVDAPLRGGSHPLPDTSASGEYRGDLGYRCSTGTYSIDKPAFIGLIYCYGSATCSGGPNFFGAIIVKGNVSGTGNPVIYFDLTAAQNMQTTGNIRPTRQSWKELPPTWSL
ncbi:MAG: hypothetical protein A2551_08135 [Elusimicrobia bacterium RIFOXYD2_FULL_34_30]|nr:MAG: hypothetical protein A2551_08135 [Elusimicrobia bacterium RIFOXYD2_FULL_34_30]